MPLTAFRCNAHQPPKHFEKLMNPRAYSPPKVLQLGKLRTSCSSVGNGRLRDAEKPAFQSL
ncbi:hypothetical protein, partial [Pseudomonas sp. FSL R10-2398]|uniref:hypothetical protein n=1 Tax=Pseudomonas sp. FSL R10-2398 TaxID=2662201 RepID=UPI001C49A181